ncbi:MAG: threonine aldolase family protein [Fimbriimonadaceae bacterium]
MSEVIDLRSDTVTRPTPEMFEAMRQAALGDDVLGDDPTVMRLEQLAAERTGKESAVFVPSGTMGNQIALAVHCRPGDAVLFEQQAHILYYEVGAPAVIANVVCWSLPSENGILEPKAVSAAVLKKSLHTPGTTLLCIENTHNRHGGRVTSVERMAEYRVIADEKGFKIHLDGARVFNAAAYLGVPVSDLTTAVDSVTFCLSKGLRAPVGSVLCGSSEFIDEARIWRKRLGGGMRQSGLLAACGILALERYADRLSEDHDRAKRLAAELQAFPGMTCDPSGIQTNIVLVDTDIPAAVWESELASEGVLSIPFGDNRLRFMTHADIDDAMISSALEKIRKTAERLAQG